VSAVPPRQPSCVSRRCLGRGLRVALTGDVDRLRDVSFKSGTRLIARDTQAPSRHVVPARPLRRPRAPPARRLPTPPPVRVIVGRTLPRYGGRPP